MWQVIYCAKRKNKLLSRKGWRLINGLAVGSSPGSWGTPPAKGHLYLPPSRPAQLGPQTRRFMGCEPATRRPLGSRVWKVKCQISICFQVGGESHKGHVRWFKVSEKEWQRRKLGWLRVIKDPRAGKMSLKSILKSENPSVHRFGIIWRWFTLFIP